MTTLYVITRVLTFFGTEMRTLWELIACRIYRIPVEDVRAFKSNELCGHTEHELAERRDQALFICWFPLTMNFILGCCLVLLGSYRMVYVGDFTSITSWIYMWLGISFFANCFPSYEDALSLKDFLYAEPGGRFSKIVLAPFFGLVWAGAWLERFSLTFPIAIAAAVGFPYIFTVFFPFFNQIAQA